ncbi:hypothetical protein AKJ16_DCAP14229 [Drosera capensis]
MRLFPGFQYPFYYFMIFEMLSSLVDTKQTEGSLYHLAGWLEKCSTSGNNFRNELLDMRLDQYEQNDVKNVENGA